MDETPSRAESDFRYRVALSFAGEDRTYVDAVAEELKRLGIADYFLDSEHDVELWGKDLVEYFERVFFTESLYVVVFISAHYAAKQWTRHELRSAMARALTEKNEYILPARFDDTELEGILPTVAYIDLKKRSPQSLAALVAEKIRWVDRVESTAGHAPNDTNREHSRGVDELAIRVLDYSADMSKDAVLTSTLIDETEAIANRLGSTGRTTVQSKEGTQRIVESTGQVVAPLSNALAKLAYFRGATQTRWIVNTIERVGQAYISDNQPIVYGGLDLLPATIVSYAAVVGAFLGGQVDAMSTLLLAPKLVAKDGSKCHWATQFNTLTCFGKLQNANLVPGKSTSEYYSGMLLKQVLAALPFQKLASCPERFAEAFECTEYAVGLICELFHEESRLWAPPAGTLVTYFGLLSDDRDQQRLLDEVAASGLVNALQNHMDPGVNTEPVRQADARWLSRLKTRT